MKTKQDILALVAEHACLVVPGLEAHAFTESDSLAALGANSMDRAEIVVMVQEALALRIPRVELFGPRNIGELADLFLSKLNAA